MMKKKVLSSLFIVLFLSAGFAHADRRWGGGWHGGGDGWFLPALIGGAALGYMVSQPQTVYVQSPPVVYAPPPQTVYVQTPPPVTVAPQGEYSGPPPRPLYKEVIEYDPQCNCNVKVQRQVGWQ